MLLLQVFVTERKLFTLDCVDDHIKKLNVRFFDGEKPSTLSGISLASCDSNLHQHGNVCYCSDLTLLMPVIKNILVLTFHLCSCTDVDFGSLPSFGNWSHDPRRR